MKIRYTKIQEEANFRIMRVLHKNPDINQGELAGQLNMSLGGINYCLAALIDKGFVKVANFHKSKINLSMPTYLLLEAFLKK